MLNFVELGSYITQIGRISQDPDGTYIWAYAHPNGIAGVNVLKNPKQPVTFKCGVAKSHKE